MRHYINSILLLTTCIMLVYCSSRPNIRAAGPAADTASLTVQFGDTMDTSKVVKSDEEWEKQLTEEQYRILREKGTEVPFDNEYWNLKDEGVYYCAGCGNPLYTSNEKYSSGCGWPSFWKPIHKNAVKEQMDYSHGMTRTEIVCARCESHLGHVFEDGPKPTGLRYCMNSAAMIFKKEE